MLYLYARNIKNIVVAAQTMIHEYTHFHYHIGGCQHAEAICFAFEKMHLVKRDFLYDDEWEYVKKLATDNYTDAKWEAGGYGNYEQFNFVRKRKKD